LAPRDLTPPENFQESPNPITQEEKYPNVMMDQLRRSTSFFEIFRSKEFGSMRKGENKIGGWIGESGSRGIRGNYKLMLSDEFVSQ